MSDWTRYRWIDSVDGPLFGEDFEQELLTAGKARRFRA